MSSRYAEALKTVFDPIIGLPCWAAQLGHGSFVTMEFGVPKADAEQPRGQWHLWIYCCHWRLLRAGRELCNSDQLRDGLRKVIPSINWCQLVAFDARPPGSSAFSFSDGFKLETSPYKGIYENWMLFQPNGLVLTYRNDGWIGQTPAAGGTVTWLAPGE